MNAWSRYAPSRSPAREETASIGVLSMNVRTHVAHSRACHTTTERQRGFIVIPFFLSAEMLAALFQLNNSCPAADGSSEQTVVTSREDTAMQKPSSPTSIHGLSEKVSAISFVAASTWDKETRERSIRRTRFDVLEMLGIVLRAVDYSTKAYAFGFVDFARYALNEREQLAYISKAIIATSQRLYKKDIHTPQISFGHSARAISVALFSTGQHAYNISSHAIELSRQGRYQRSAALIQGGQHITEFLRLCIVAIMEQNVEHVETVLRRIDEGRSGSCTQGFGAESVAPTIHASDVRTRIMGASVERMLENLSTVAAASLAIIQLSP
jgi:hypothetical protein